MASPYEPLFNRYGAAFGVNPQLLHHVGRRESNFQADAYNDWDSNARAGIPSRGIMQFIEPTFNSFYAQARKSNPEVFSRFGSGNWTDPEQQIALAAWAFANNKGSHWATYQDALRDAGGNATGPQGGMPAMGTPDGLVAAAAQPGPMQSRLHDYLDDRGYRMTAGVLRSQQAAAPASPAMPSEMGGGVPNPVAGGGDIPAQLPGEPTWRYLQRMLGDMFGLQNDPGDSQTTGGRHTEGSLHYAGRAIDFGDARNSRAQLDAAYAWLNARRQQLGITELIWQAPGHYNHLHVAI